MSVVTGAVRHRGRRRSYGLDERQMQAFLIDASEIEICIGDDGREVVLGAGTYGVVSHLCNYSDCFCFVCRCCCGLPLAVGL